jgi:hypothetical protein
MPDFDMGIDFFAGAIGNLSEKGAGQAVIKWTTPAYGLHYRTGES